MFPELIEMIAYIKEQKFGPYMEPFKTIEHPQLKGAVGLILGVLFQWDMGPFPHTMGEIGQRNITALIESSPNLTRLLRIKRRDRVFMVDYAPDIGDSEKREIAAFIDAADIWRVVK